MRPTKDKHYRGISGKMKAPYTKWNIYLFILGIVFLILGYLALAQGPWDGFLSLTLAPILLVIAYCVVIPASILYRQKPKQDVQT